MFFEPQPTPYDLRWTMFGIPVRVSPWFWVMGAFLGWTTTRQGLDIFVVWMGCVFLSILVHELGHVFMGRLFGTDGHIVLYALGGLAIGSNALPGRWQRMAVSFAGPLAGFMLYGVVLAAESRMDLEALSNPAYAALRFLKYINLYWGVLNLVPIFPLDGGQISRDFLSVLSPRRGAYLAYGISFLCAAVLAGHALLVQADRGVIPHAPGGIYSALLFGSLALSSYTALQHEHENLRRWTDPDDD